MGRRQTSTKGWNTLNPSEFPVRQPGDETRMTVVICTWNRAPLLRQTLEGMLGLRVPEGLAWELLVVNNNCTDETSSVLAHFRNRLPLREIREPRPGKSHALNRAVDDAVGEYLLFTDDDVLVDPDWLAAYALAFQRHPEAALFGGPIRPWFEGEPPAWLVSAFHQVEFAYATLDLGDAPISLKGQVGPLGANMAVRLRDQRQHRYDPGLGPRPGSGLRGEETAMVKRLFEAGAVGYWVPEAQVRHFIPRARQTTRFLREWYQGWGEYLVRTRTVAPSRTLLGRPPWLWRDMVEGAFRYRFRRLFSPPSRWVEALKREATAQGMFRACGSKDVPVGPSPARAGPASPSSGDPPQ